MKFRLLLVEDEPGVRSLATVSLQRYGYNVLAASDGDEAWAVAQANGKATEADSTEVDSTDLDSTEAESTDPADEPGDEPAARDTPPGPCAVAG